MRMRTHEQPMHDGRGYFRVHACTPGLCDWTAELDNG